VKSKKEATHEVFWNNFATEKLRGKTIVSARQMTKDEAEAIGFYSRPLVLWLSDGSYVFSMSDDEGNNGGALAGGKGDKEWTFPVIM